jgi:hypothetical protein
MDLTTSDKSSHDIDRSETKTASKLIVYEFATGITVKAPFAVRPEVLIKERFSDKLFDVKQAIGSPFHFSMQSFESIKFILQIL